jgi:perosamine synthetase
MVLRDHGRTPGDIHFFNGEVGFKYKLSSMQAALGLAQLERIDELVSKKRQVFRWYAEAFRGTKGVTLNAEPAGTLNTYWMVTVILDRSLQIEKERVMSALREHHIDSRPFFHPLSSLPAYRGSPDAAAARKRNTVSYEISPYGVNLPSGLDMTEAKVALVVSVLRRLLD